MDNPDPHRAGSEIGDLLNPPVTIPSLIKQAMYNHNGGEKATIKATVCPNTP
jgi:hypothetical protein